MTERIIFIYAHLLTYSIYFKNAVISKLSNPKPYFFTSLNPLSGKRGCHQRYQENQAFSSFW
ncbi:hypothetical protein Cal7507_3966 [Calothrix sp. PCC 7507]|nr:hypothetical protein Cal7507_3966 [Calothrix sp. PCC 7507]